MIGSFDLISAGTQYFIKNFPDYKLFINLQLILKQQNSTYPMLVSI